MIIDKNLLENLNKHCDAEFQKKTVEILSKLPLKDIKHIVLPNGKESWDNASEVIYNIIYRNINKDKKVEIEEKESLLHIMEWTKDLNWPGATTIISAIKLLQPILIAELIEKSLIQAINDKDETWIDFLKIIFNLIGNIEEIYFDNNKYYQILLEDN